MATKPGYFQTFAQGHWGHLAKNDVQIHGFHAAGRQVLAVQPGHPGEEVPVPDRNFTFLPPGLSVNKTSWALVLIALALFFIGDALHLPKWVAIAVIALGIVAVVFRPIFASTRVWEGAAKQRDVVTVVLSGQEPLKIMEVRATDPAIEWPAGATGVVIVAYDLPAAARAKMIRSFLGTSLMESAMVRQDTGGQS